MFTVELRKQLLDSLYIKNNRIYMLNNPFGILVNAVRETCQIDLGPFSDNWFDEYIEDETLRLLVLDYIKTKELNFNLMDERLTSFFYGLFKYHRLYIVCEIQFDQSYIKNLKYFKKELKNFLFEHPRVYIVKKLFNERDYFVVSVNTNEAVATTVSYIEQLIVANYDKILNMNHMIVNQSSTNMNKIKRTVLFFLFYSKKVYFYFHFGIIKVT